MCPPHRALAAPASFVAAALIALAACGGDSEEQAPSPSIRATLAVTPVALTKTPSASPFGGGTDPVEATPPPAGFNAALLTDVRIAAQDGFDRITLEFDSVLPGFRVQYVEPPIIADASGLEVKIAGEAFIEIRMEPAAAHDPDSGEETYTGPKELKAGLQSIVEAERTGDFEGVLTWVVGAGRRSDFRVLTLEAPPRLVVDVAHP